MADVFARAAVRKRGIQRPLVSDVGDREKRSATVKNLRKCTKILDKLELGEKKTSSRGLVFCTLPPPKNGKNKSQGDLFFPPFPPKTEKQVPRGLVAKVP